MADEIEGPLLYRRLVAVHRSLDAAGFDHAVGGAIALAVHVLEPRFTADIDLNVTADPQAPESLLATLPDGVVVPDDAARTVRREGQVRLPWPDPSTPLDLFLPQHPRFHHMVVDRAVPVAFLGHGIKVLDATDLMVFKCLFARSKDWVDVQSLLAAGAGDRTEALTWLTELVGADDVRVQRLSGLTPQA